MIPEFTADEQRALAPFFTNLDRSVFGLKLPQEVAGALFSRYSRSTKSLRRTFFDEFLGDPELGLKDLLGAQTSASDDSAALKKARAFYDRVLVGYGDDSVAQLGGAHIACENISNVAAKLLRRRAHRHRAAGEIDALRALRPERRRRKLSLLPRAQDHGVAPSRLLRRSDESTL